MAIPDQSNPAMPRHPTVAYIVGSGRVGSTLLDRILNGHPAVLALGELNDLATFAKSRPADPIWQRACIRLGVSELSEVDVRVPTWRGMRSFLRDLETWAVTNDALILELAAAADVAIVTDASKRPERLLAYLKSGKDVRVIHLVRDGRAVVNSYSRRYGDAIAGIRTWMSTNLTALLLQRRYRSVPWIRVTYEELADDPERVCVDVCALLEIKPNPSMVAGRGTGYVGVSGSPTTNADPSAPIVEDRRWMGEMSLAHRALFLFIGSPLNRYFGYKLGRKSSSSRD